MTEPITSKRMVAAIASILRIQNHKTFLARVGQLQRMGIPPGSNTGRGTTCSYTIDQALGLLIAFDMLSIGLSPAVIVELFGDGLEAYLKSNAVSDSHAIITADALAHLRDDASDAAGAMVVVFPARRLKQLQAELGEAA